MIQGARLVLVRMGHSSCSFHDGRCLHFASKVSSNREQLKCAIWGLLTATSVV